LSISLRMFCLLVRENYPCVCPTAFSTFFSSVLMDKLMLRSDSLDESKLRMSTMR